jgi:phosphoglycolate phosphatase-like HAD superfamily hydrolase
MSRPAPARAGVIFDIDGTLVDSNYQHCLAWWHSFRDEGYDVSAADIHRCIGMGSDRLVEHLLGHSDDAVGKAHGRHYAPNLQQLRAFPEAAPLLADSRNLGLAVLLASSAPEDEVEALLDAIGNREDVDVVTASADAEESKPAPDIIEVALERIGLPPSSCIMVGDTVWDVAAAERAGMPCIGVLSGGISAAELQEAGAVEVYRDVRHLRQCLRESGIGRLAG